MDRVFEQEIIARLDSLAARVDALERTLANASTPAAQVAAVTGANLDASDSDANSVKIEDVMVGPQETAPNLKPSPSADGRSAIPIEAPTSAQSASGKRERLAELAEHWRHAEAGAQPSAVPPTTPPPHTAQSIPSPARAPRVQRQAGEFERWIGARWYAGAGALIVVIGMGLLVKLAFDRGWLSLPPAVRCLLGACCGGGLIALAEVIRKRLSPLAAMGLYSAGLGSVFASAYAAYRLYDLLDAPIAFALLAIVGLIGVGISIRAQMPGVGMLSLTGGYVTPFLFWDAPPRPLVLPAYTLTLLAVGLIVTAIKGPTYTGIRRIAWLGTAIVGAIWLVSMGREHNAIAFGYLTLVWASVHAELCWSAARNQLGIPRTVRLNLTITEFFAWRAYFTSFATTSWVFGFALHVLMSIKGDPSWLGAAALTGATALVACGLAGFPAPFIERPSNDRERLAACLVVQSAGALIATVALAFVGALEVFSWAFLSLTALLAGRWLKARPFFVFALICLVIQTARLCFFDSWRGVLTKNPLTFAGLNFSLWTVCMEVAAMLWLTGARLVADEWTGSRLKWPALLAAIGCAVSLGGIALGSSAQSIVYAWIIMGTLFACANGLDRRLALIVHAAITTFAATIALFIAFPATSWSESTLTLHPGIIAGFAVVAAFCLIGEFARREAATAHIRHLLHGAAVVVFFIVTTLEVTRIAESIAADPAARRSALSIWWAVFAVALITAGFLRMHALPRRIGLALLAVAALKAVVLDLNGVPAAWRVASFLGIGLLMVAVGVGYSKLSIALDSGSDRHDENTQSDHEGQR